MQQQTAHARDTAQPRPPNRASPASRPSRRPKQPAHSARISTCPSRTRPAPTPPPGPISPVG